MLTLLFLYIVSGPKKRKIIGEKIRALMRSRTTPKDSFSPDDTEAL